MLLCAYHLLSQNLMPLPAAGNGALQATATCAYGYIYDLLMAIPMLTHEQ